MGLRLVYCGACGRLLWRALESSGTQMAHSYAFAHTALRSTKAFGGLQRSGVVEYLLIMKFLTKSPDGLSWPSVQGPVALAPG